MSFESTVLRSIALCLRHAALLERQAAAAKARGVTVAGGATGKVKLGKTRTGWHGAHMLICLRFRMSEERARYHVFD